MKSGPIRNEIDYKESEERLVKKVKDYLVDSTEKIGFSIMLINYWQLHDQIDLVRACDNLIELNLMGCVLDLIGKRSNFSQDAKTKV